MKITHLDLNTHPEFAGHQSVTEFECDQTGLHAIIAVHNTNLGPSLGGCRFYPYPTRDDAITDVLRLSKGMTYKSALAGLALGGGKAVIIGDPKKIRTPEMMQTFGTAIESLGGQYITAEDVGSTEHDMIEISKTTSYVAGLPADGQNDHVSGNPSPITALGTFYGIKAAIKHQLKRDNLMGLHIAIQGMGAVGRALADHLLNASCTLSIADMNAEILEQYKNNFEKRINIVATDKILLTECDVLAPCAMGAILNEQTIPNLNTKIIAGAANNQLKTEHDDARLHAHGILYAPDYAINSGGITSVGYEYFARSNRNPYTYALTHDNMLTHVKKIENTMLTIFETAAQKNIPTGLAADKIAEAKFKNTK